MRIHQYCSSVLSLNSTISLFQSISQSFPYILFSCHLSVECKRCLAPRWIGWYIHKIGLSIWTYKKAFKWINIMKLSSNEIIKIKEISQFVLIFFLNFIDNQSLDWIWVYFIDQNWWNLCILKIWNCTSFNEIRQGNFFKLRIYFFNCSVNTCTYIIKIIIFFVKKRCK